VSKRGVTSGGQFPFGLHVLVGDVLAEGDGERGGLRVPDLLVAAFVDLLEEVAGGLVQRRHIAPLPRKSLDVHRVREVPQVHPLSARLPQLV